MMSSFEVDEKKGRGKHTKGILTRLKDISTPLSLNFPPNQ